MDLETATYIAGGVLSTVCLVLLIWVSVLTCSISNLKKQLEELQNTTKLRVQKLKLEPNKDFAYHNPNLTPDEELTKRGYSMYRVDDDVESGRGTERQTGGQLVFAEDLAREQEKKKTAPPFLLEAIEENKRRSRSLSQSAPVHKSNQPNSYEQKFLADYA